MKIALEQINETDLDEICQKFIMSEKARLLYKVHYDRHLFLLALIESKCFSDAILFIIHSLPQKKAIQWACHSALNFHEEPLSFDDLVALNAVESWLLDSSDINHQNTQILKPVDTPDGRELIPTNETHESPALSASKSSYEVFSSYSSFEQHGSNSANADAAVIVSNIPTTQLVSFFIICSNL